MSSLTLKELKKIEVVERDREGRTYDIDKIMSNIYSIAIERVDTMSYIRLVTDYLDFLVNKKKLPNEVGTIMLLFADTFVGSTFLAKQPEDIQDVVHRLRESFDRN